MISSLCLSLFKSRISISYVRGYLQGLRKRLRRADECQSSGDRDSVQTVANDTTRVLDTKTLETSALEQIRTAGLRFRKPTLYPSELRGRIFLSRVVSNWLRWISELIPPMLQHYQINIRRFRRKKKEYVIESCGSRTVRPA